MDRSPLDVSYGTDMTSDGCLADTSASADTEDTDVERDLLAASHPILHPRTSSAMRRDGGRSFSQARERADLICAQGRILQLETVVERMQRATKRARVLEEDEEDEKRRVVKENAKQHKVGTPASHSVTPWALTYMYTFQPEHWGRGNSHVLTEIKSTCTLSVTVSQHTLTKNM